jgi:alkanesulfonate monooxygenase SsuD/methylene tetrahydromethanopterin reductase-like flavin-dependent oxidoreductase (luciferase family)
MVDLGRTSDDVSNQELVSRLTELVAMADAADIEAVYTGEHHGHELTMAPNPFQLLSYWASQFSRIRLGTAVVCAPYWHPIRLAGEAGLLDVLSSGRCDLGVGRGAYPYEFARMANGMSPEVARETLEEMLHCLRGLWAGDYSHSGSRWTFPSSTSTPRPVDPAGPPLWVSARHPDVFRMAVETRSHVMVAPLDMPFEEVVSLRDRLDTATTNAGNGWQADMMVLRDAAVYDTPAGRADVIARKRGRDRYFDSLFRTEGRVENGFVQPVDTASSAYSDEEIWENNVFGTPDEVVRKLKQYEAAGTDVFVYGATFGLDWAQEKRSMRLLVDEVLPAFRNNS